MPTFWKRLFWSDSQIEIPDLPLNKEMKIHNFCVQFSAVVLSIQYKSCIKDRNNGEDAPGSLTVMQYHHEQWQRHLRLEFGGVYIV
jgi:hypothetical protein